MTKLPSRRTGPVLHQIEIMRCGLRQWWLRDSRQPIRRMMRAISDIVDDSTLGGEFGAHPVVQRAQLVLVKKPRATPD